MGNIFLAPSWFFGYDVLLELAFAVITLIVSIYAFKVYKLSGQHASKIFGMAFALISASYFVQSAVNFAILSKLNENICQSLKVISVTTLNAIGIYFYIILFIAGLVTLTYMTLKVKNLLVLLPLILITILALVFSPNTLYLFYFISSILLLTILTSYLIKFIRKKQKNTLLMVIAFVFLLFGSVHFIFSVNHGLYYVIGHFLELIAYIFILTNLIIVIKK